MLSLVTVLLLSTSFLHWFLSLLMNQMPDKCWGRSIRLLSTLCPESGNGGKCWCSGGICLFNSAQDWSPHSGYGPCPANLSVNTFKCVFHSESKSHQGDNQDFPLYSPATLWSRFCFLFNFLNNFLCAHKLFWTQTTVITLSYPLSLLLSTFFPRSLSSASLSLSLSALIRWITDLGLLVWAWAGNYLLKHE